MTSPPLDSTHDWQRRAWHDITPLDNTHGRQRRAWHDTTAFGQHTWSDYVRRGMTSLPLESTHDRTTSGVICHHRLWAAHTVERRVACHHRRWAAHMVERCQAWHDITILGLHARSNDVGRGMTSLPLDSTHGRTTSGMA
uniref:Uncharacterized protein n=1 Tax=Solanum lycopersicum TaxID=4081 RepID=A0A3Q7IGM0_SOLLC